MFCLIPTILYCYHKRKEEKYYGKEDRIGKLKNRCCCLPLGLFSREKKTRKDSDYDKNGLYRREKSFKNDIDELYNN